MRELKFRVWSEYWEEYATEAELYMDGSVDAIFEDTEGVQNHDNSDLVVESNTGLKDKNGKEIYEGDIVSGHTPSYIGTFEIAWRETYTLYRWYRIGSHHSLFELA